MKPLRFPTALTPPVLRRLGLADVVILCLVAGAIATVVAFAREFEAPFLQAVRIDLRPAALPRYTRSEEHTSELQSRLHLVCRLLLEKKKRQTIETHYHKWQ